MVKVTFYLFTDGHGTFYGKNHHFFEGSDVWKIKEYGFRTRSGAVKAAAAHDKFYGCKSEICRTVIEFTDEDAKRFGFVKETKI